MKATRAVDLPGPQLSPQDAACLDAMVEGAASPDPERHKRLEACLGLLEQLPPVQIPSNLLAKTMARVAGAPRSRPQLAADEPPAVLSFPRRDWTQWGAVGVAASLMLALVIPGLQRARESALRAGCASNLAMTGQALGVYANNFENALPCLALPADGNWLPRPNGALSSGDTQAHSNSDNLLPLVQNDYVSWHRLNCRGSVENRPAGSGIDTVGSYSYLNQFGPIRHRWDGLSATVVLADRNPLFQADLPIRDPGSNSWNHRRQGNNLLSADGHVSWSLTPNAGPDGDNIWTIGKPALVSYTGREVVSSEKDLFLSP